MRRSPSFASTAPMKELYDGTVRHEPKGNHQTPLLVRPSALKRHIVDRDEMFGPDGWNRYLDGFAELAEMEPEREMEPDLMPMMG